MDFEAKRYLTDLKQALKSAQNEIQFLLYQRLRDRVRSLPMKDNPVKLDGGRITSDVERREALLNSMVRHQQKWSKKQYTEILTGVVSAMEENFTESHIGWYYEIGTGVKSDPSLYSRYGLSSSLGEPNPYRMASVGSEIVSRNRANGTWRDLGGNVRTTGSRIGGVGGSGTSPLKEDGSRVSDQSLRDAEERFIEYIGEDVMAHRWFELTVRSMEDELLKHYREALSKVDIKDYIIVRTLKV